jgi:hypothetical protein
LIQIAARALPVARSPRPPPSFFIVSPDLTAEILGRIPALLGEFERLQALLWGQLAIRTE